MLPWIWPVATSKLAISVLRAVAAILEFAALDLARPHGQGRRDPLQSLDAGHLVD
jgi:hypothetical protein